MEYRDESLLDNKYLVGSKIVDIFVSRLKGVSFEGGLTIIFEKDGVRGLVIFGYTELGEWIEYYEYQKEVIIDTFEWQYDIKHEHCDFAKVEYINRLKKDYDIQ